jgi:hypothetical protein
MTPKTTGGRRASGAGSTRFVSSSRFEVALKEVMRDLRKLIHCVHIAGPPKVAAPMRHMRKGKLG